MEQEAQQIGVLGSLIDILSFCIRQIIIIIVSIPFHPMDAASHTPWIFVVVTHAFDALSTVASHTSASIIIRGHIITTSSTLWCHAKEKEQGVEVEDEQSHL